MGIEQGLNERLAELLEASIEEYIKNYVPIASGNIQAKAQIQLSPATIRSDLKTLEHLGYLKQLHTSGGRIPTTSGYRFYVNKVMNQLRAKHGELRLAAETITGRLQSLPDVIEDVCRKLSTSLNYPIIVKREFDKLVVREAHVIPLVEGSTMVLIKTMAGSITQTITTGRILTERESEDASRAITVHMAGKTLGEVIQGLKSSPAEISKQLGTFESLVKTLGQKLEETLESNVSHHMNMIKLLDIPDYANVEKMKQLGKIVGNTDNLNTLMSLDQSIVIGAEIDPGIEDTSIIKFDYKIGDERVASVGILGPERMDYKELIVALYSLLDQTQENRLLTERRAADGESRRATKRKKEKG